MRGVIPFSYILKGGSILFSFKKAGLCVFVRCFAGSYRPPSGRNNERSLSMWSQFYYLTHLLSPIWSFLFSLFFCQKNNFKMVAWKKGKKKKLAKNILEGVPAINVAHFNNDFKKYIFSIAFLPNVCETKLFFFSFFALCLRHFAVFVWRWTNPL